MTKGQFRSRPARPATRLAGTDPAAEDRRAPGLVTFLAIDLAEASAVLAGLGEGHVDSLRTAYLALVRNALAAHRGRELLRQDDRVLVAFDTPSDAVACAVAVQRATKRHNLRQADRFDVRIGVHLGEAVEATAASARGDYVALPAAQARQVCDAAGGGRILVSALVSALARSEGSYTFERAGLVDLEGMPDPVPTFEVVYQAAASARPPLPAELAARPAGRCAFVGRATERQGLRSTWDAAAAGERRLVFAVGEPGIGKSRLAAEFAMEAHEDGAIVLSGRSFEEQIVPYQPFVEALRQYVADCDPADLEAQLGADPGALATLLPELASRVPQLTTPGSEEGERYRLFDAVAAFLAGVSVGSPTLLLLDDLQWADPATLLLLKHIVLDPRPAALLILGLYRDTEVGMSHPLSRLQADVERDFPVERITLTGLGDEEVGSMLDAMIGWSPPPAVTRELCTDTEGNPFFLQEVIHQLDEQGVVSDRERMLRGHLVSGDFSVPSRVRDFVARRMQRLSAGALEVLEVAAIVGTEFGLEVLAAVLSSDAERLVDHLEEAVEARLVVEVVGRPGSYVFTHALVQQALHEGHGINRRAVLHARVAEAIETLRPDDPSTLSELARHYALTAGRYAEKVVHYGSAAGDRALSGLAYEDAIEEYQRALDALPLVPSADELTRADLLVRLGEAHTRAGDAAAAKECFLAAADHCVGEGSSTILARTALGYGGTGKLGGTFDPFQVVNETLVDLLERALEACSHDDETTRVRLLGRLAQALYWSNDKERMLSLSQEALDTARRVGDKAAIAHALHSRHTALWDPDHIAEIRAAAEEMLELGESLGDRDIRLKAYAWLITDALETDPFEVVDGYITSYASLSEALQRPYLVGYAEAIRAAQAHLEGRFDDMFRLMAIQLAICEGAYSQRAQEAHRWQKALLLLDLGRVDDGLISDLAGLAERYPRSPFRVMLAFAYASQGRRDEASAELVELAPDQLAAIPKDFMWAATLIMLARVVSRLGAVDYARPLYDLLEPYAQRNLLWGSGFMIFGPVSRYLGMLATTLGQPDLALKHLEHALTHSHELGSPPLVARAQVDMARALLSRAADGDGERIGPLLEEAKLAATELDMPRLAQDASELLSATAASVARRPEGS